MSLLSTVALGSLVILLGIEYYFFCKQTTKLLTLQKRYTSLIDGNADVIVSPSNASAFELQHSLHNSALVQSKKASKIGRRISQQKTKADISCAHEFCWPVNRGKCWLSSHFGPRTRPDGSKGFHYGVDMAALRGTPVYAARDGTVEQAETHAGYGNTIFIHHGDNFKTRYAHLDTLRVVRKQMVKKGELIGTVGNTGNTRKMGHDSSHLHFEVYQGTKRVNPLSFLQ